MVETCLLGHLRALPNLLCWPTDQMAGLTVVKTQDGVWDNAIAWLKNLNDVWAGLREAFLEHLLTPFSPVQ